MNLHIPFRVTWLDGNSLLIKSYELPFFTSDADVRSVEEVKLTSDNFYSGFLLEEGRAPIDLRVNEGMCFSLKSASETRLEIESYLHSYAFDEDKIRERTKKQLERKAV